MTESAQYSWFSEEEEKFDKKFCFLVFFFCSNIDPVYILYAKRDIFPILSILSENWFVWRRFLASSSHRSSIWLKERETYKKKVMYGLFFVGGLIFKGIIKVSVDTNYSFQRSITSLQINSDITIIKYLKNVLWKTN